jgi:hypothetical protein
MKLKHTASRLIKRALRHSAPQMPRKPASPFTVALRIAGSYPPLAEYYMVGPAENYFIHSGYKPRLENAFFDDTDFEGEWQDEVYQFANEIAGREQLASVCDVGCGSAFKLMKYFPEIQTIGLDLEPTVRKLRNKYPNRRWLVCDFSIPPPFSPDLVICSDVIEHLADPNQLLEFVGNLRPRYIIFSTPDRNLFRIGSHNGPPRNPAHVREWSMPQFRAYIETRFEVLDHFISNASQCTQCLLARPIVSG